MVVSLEGVLHPDPIQRLRALPLGTRVVVRRRVAGGLTDVLGYLRTRDDSSCRIESRTGLVIVEWSDIVLAKPIPEPPARRPLTSNPEPGSGGDEVGSHQ